MLLGQFFWVVAPQGVNAPIRLVVAAPPQPIGHVRFPVHRLVPVCLFGTSLWGGGSFGSSRKLHIQRSYICCPVHSSYRGGGVSSSLSNTRSSPLPSTSATTVPADRACSSAPSDPFPEYRVPPPITIVYQFTRGYADFAGVVLNHLVKSADVEFSVTGIAFKVL